MLKIRLQRFGKKNSPSFRVVLVEHTAPPKGKFLEILGFYNPRKKEKNFKKERIEHWISKGVQLSPTIHNLLVGEGILNKPKIKAWRVKRSGAKSAEVPQQRDEGGKKKKEPPVVPQGTMEGKEKPIEAKPAETVEKPAETKIEEPKIEQPIPETPKTEESSILDKPQ